jgi:hypothetical protein
MRGGKYAPSRARKPAIHFGQAVHTDGSVYDADELEFIQAMERWMRENRCRFPKFTDVLRVAKSLGWRRVK